ncbi:MAG: hypothetical protein HC767_06455 [Akkermansiaceae bacterium]|nr:hypothetical protein [Akkermansiaceae bacterium]
MQQRSRPKARSCAADVESLWNETNEINGWTLARWDAFFEPGIASDEGVEGRQYALKPVDGDAKYSRHAAELVTKREDPHQDLHMVWPEFALRVSHLQAVNVTLLLQELSRHQVQHTHTLVLHIVALPVQFVRVMT